jgi:hypothetical protein
MAAFYARSAALLRGAKGSRNGDAKTPVAEFRISKQRHIQRAIRRDAFSFDQSRK